MNERARHVLGNALPGGVALLGAKELVDGLVESVSARAEFEQRKRLELSAGPSAGGSGPSGAAPTAPATPDPAGCSGCGELGAGGVGVGGGLGVGIGGFGGGF